MQIETIESRALKVIQKQLGSKQVPKLTDRLVADLGCDSLDFLELAMFLEDEFRIEIVDEDAMKCVTVADAIALVSATQAA